MDPDSSAAVRAAYINGHDVSGIQTPDSSTIVFTLTQPATVVPAGGVTHALRSPRHAHPR